MLIRLKQGLIPIFFSIYINKKNDNTLSLNKTQQSTNIKLYSKKMMYCKYIET